MINLLLNILLVKQLMEFITMKNSFIVRQNKIGIGNGEAKLYIGQDGQETRSFFGSNGFGITCFLLKDFRK